MPYIFVDIPVEGDWPSPEDMAVRNEITDELDALNIGEFGGAGGGMGSMDFSYNVTDAEAAEGTIREMLAKYLPDRDFSIRVTDG